LQFVRGPVRNGGSVRPLNSAVRHHVKKAPLVCAVIGAVGYTLLWILISTIAIRKEDLNGVWMLAILTVPSSSVFLLVPLPRFDGIVSLAVHLLAFLIVGVVQYGFIGYIVGLALKRLGELGRRDA
jgi:hypothetical protein